MLGKDKLARINELARKSKEEGLSPEEREEQQVLRKEYLAVFRQHFRQQLDSVKIVKK